MKKIILIGLILILGLCVMTVPVSAKIYNEDNHGCYGSLLIPPWDPVPPPMCSFTPSANGACDEQGEPYIHLTWPAETGVADNYFKYPLHPWDVGTPSWNYVYTEGDETAGMTSLDFYTCGSHFYDIMILQVYEGGDSCIAVAPIDMPACPSSTLVPIAATNTVGQTHTLTATFVFGSGQPLSDQTVTFSITAGPNAGMTGTAVTNAQGVATWSYSSSSQGKDTIIATWDDQIEQMHLQTNEAQKTWIAGNNVPEFPSAFLPTAMIIGFLGAVLLIQRTRKQ